MADHDYRRGDRRDERNYRRPGGERDFYGRDERGEDDYGVGFGEEGLTNYRLRDPSNDRYSSGPGARYSGYDSRSEYGVQRRDRQRDFGSDFSSNHEYGSRPSLYGRSDRDFGGQHRWEGDRGSQDHDRGWWDRATDEVSSWFGDEDGERRRKLDARHQGRGPKGYRRSDDRIREDISDRLTDDPFIDASDIEIAVENAEVTLTGTVDSRNARRRAEDMAERCSGVTHVQNNLRVTSGAETVREERDPTNTASKGLFTK